MGSEMCIRDSGVILKRPRDRQHGDINPDPPATAQLQHAITWKPYGLVPFFGYRLRMPWVGKEDSTISTYSKETIEHTWGKNCVPLWICGYRFFQDVTFAPYLVLRTRRRRRKGKSNVQSEPMSPPVSTHLQRQSPRCSRNNPHVSRTG